MLAAPLAAVWWSAEPSVWPYALASTLLETVYVVALAYAYRLGDLSFVYPLTRGLAPVLTLGARPSPCSATRVSAAEVAGVLLVAAGVVLVRGPQGQPRRAGARRDHDDLGVDRRLHARRPRRDPARGRAHLLRPRPRRAGLVYPPVVGLRAVRARDRAAAALAAAAANLGSFVLGLLALRRGAAAPVLAVRSTSIVIAALLAGRVLAERGRRDGASPAPRSSSAGSRCSRSDAQPSP